MDSYILTVEKALTDYLSAGIPDIANSTHRGYDRLGKDIPDQVLSIIQASDIDDNSMSVGDSMSQRLDTKLYLIQGWVKYADFFNPTDDAHGLLAEVKKLLNELNVMDSVHAGLKGYNTSGSGKQLISYINISSGLVRPPDQDVSSKHSYFWLPVQIGLLEEVADPYKLP